MDAREPILTSSEAKAALVDILDAIEDNSVSVECSRIHSGDQMSRHMQTVFPLVAKIQAEVVHRYGFAPNGEGVVEFTQRVKMMEKQDPEIERLNQMVKASMIPPMTNAGYR